MQNTEGITLGNGKGRKLPWNLQKFRNTIQVNWSPWKKTKALISCLLKLDFPPSSEKNWPTNFTLKYLEHTAKNMMHSQFCTCVLRSEQYKRKTTQDSHEVLWEDACVMMFDWFPEMTSQNVQDPDPFDQFFNVVTF